MGLEMFEDAAQAEAPRTAAPRQSSGANSTESSQQRRDRRPRHQPNAAENRPDPFPGGRPEPCLPADAPEHQREELKQLVNEPWFNEHFMVTRVGVACRTCRFAATALTYVAHRPCVATFFSCAD